MALQTYSSNIDTFNWGTAPAITKAGVQIDDVTNEAAIIAACHAEPPYVSVYKNGILLAVGQLTPAVVGSSAQGPFSGRVTLAAGAATVNTPAAVPGVNITLTRQVSGGTLGHLSVGAIVSGVSFAVSSSSATDTSTLYWEIRH